MIYKDWLKWKRKFLQSNKKDMIYLKTDKFVCWFRHDPSYRSFNSWNMQIYNSTLWNAVLYFRSLYPTDNIEIDTYDNKGSGVTIWVTPPPPKPPEQLSLFGV